MSDKNLERIKIAIDAGNLPPFGKVRSGIHRLINSFLYHAIKLKKNTAFNYYYFGPSQQSVLHLRGVNKPVNKLQNWQTKLYIRKLPTKFFGSLLLPTAILQDKNDIFLGFCGYFPRILKPAKLKKIIFIHDLGFIKNPQYYTNSEKMITDTNFALANADKIIVFSDYIRRQISKYYSRIDRKKIFRIYAGINHLIKLPPNNIKLKISNYFLYVGVIKPVKNILQLIHIFAKYVDKSLDEDCKLILIGEKEKQYFREISQDKIFSQLKNRVIFKDTVSDKQLKQYYLKAKAVLNVSHEEGFCYPVLEALSLGKRVLVNNLPLYREFSRYFTNLKITNSNKQLLSLMSRNYKKVRMKKSMSLLFNWKNFCSEFFKLI